MAYENTQGYNDAYNAFVNKLIERANADSRVRSQVGDPVQTAQQNLGRAGQTFSQMFRQLVGRDPNEQEASSFYSNALAPNTDFGTVGAGLQFGQGFDDYVKNFVTNNYQDAANQQAMQDLQNQQGEANRLADLYRTQGKQALSDTEAALQDYQSRLFEKLRPQLMTSLQAQGLLNSGALNEAFAGQAKDLSDASQEYLLQQRLANEQQANQIAFGGASAPYQYQQAQILNRVPQLQQQGASALDRIFKTNMDNLDYQHQLGLMNEQSRLSNQGGSFLKQFGGQLLANALFNGATQMGSNLQKSSGSGGAPAMPIGAV